MKLKNICFFIDIYSKRATFYYNNHEKISSEFGVFLTIVHIIITLIITIYYLYITIQRKEIKVYNSSIYSQEMPIIEISSNNLYFAFGIEDPISSNRYIDETIYYPQILFIDRIKINGEFRTILKKELDYERCKEENFGQNYQHFLTKGELNNSYCLKDFNYNLTFAGGYKYEKMTYIRIKIFPCKNSTENNNHCKPQTIIDSYLSSAYFSILIKDFGLNPSNYSNPTIPTLQDLYTIVDRRIYRNFDINFGITEIDTDIGLFNEKFRKKRYLNYKSNFQNFSFREQKDYIEGNEICVTQLKLEDTITIQTRKYIKFGEIFSRIGGYMNLMHTIFSILSILINKFNLELKIINGIFDFNLKENKMTIKLKAFDFESMEISNYNKAFILSPKNHSKLEFDRSKFKNKNESNYINASYGLNISDSKKINDSQSNKIYSNYNIFNHINEKNIKSIRSNIHLPKFNVFINDKEDKKQVLDFKDNIRLNLFNYLFQRKNENIKKSIELYKSGICFFKKKMDIINVFFFILIAENVLLKNYKQQIYHLFKENKFLFPKN